jgi:hypothetical protein
MKGQVEKYQKLILVEAENFISASFFMVSLINVDLSMMCYKIFKTIRRR